MRTQSIYLPLLLFLLSRFASAQGVQSNAADDRQVPNPLLMGTNVLHKTPRAFLGRPNQQRMRSDFKLWTDSVRWESVRVPSPDERFIANGIEGNPAFLRKVSSPQSPIYVIDTAIVKSHSDTTRHLYSFNAKAKRTTDLTQKLIGSLWIGALWVDKGRHTNTYDASNNMLSDLYEGWSSGQWVKSERHTYTYDVHGNRLLDLWEQWSNGQWVIFKRETYTYDQHGNRLTGLWEEWSNGQLVTSSRGTYTYDERGNELTALGEMWSNGKWSISGRRKITYDANSNMLSDLDSSWYSGPTLYVTYNTYTYDASNNMLSSLHSSWSNGKSAGVFREECTYDARGNRLSYSIDYGANIRRYRYTYDANNNMLSDLFDEWYSGQWHNVNRSTYTYDGSNNMLTDLYEDWSNGQWVKDGHDTYTYDTYGNLTSFWRDLIRSIWVWTDPGFAVTDSAGNFYDFGGCYYVTLMNKLIVTGIASQGANVPATYSLYQNYPNPFNPSTTIKFELPSASKVNLSVFDICGREVSVLVNEVRNAGVYEVMFNGSTFASGAYFYRLQAGTYVETKKLLLVR